MMKVKKKYVMERGSERENRDIKMNVFHRLAFIVGIANKEKKNNRRGI